MTAFDLVAEARRLGARVVQICDNLPLVQLASSELDALLRSARDTGIRLEIGTRGIDSQALGFHLRLARRVDCPFVRVVIDRDGDEPTPAEAVGHLREVAPLCRDLGIRLALENHDRFSCAQFGWSRTVGLAGICDTVNSAPRFNRGEWCRPWRLTR